MQRFAAQGSCKIGAIITIFGCTGEASGWTLALTKSDSAGKWSPNHFKMTPKRCRRSAPIALCLRPELREFGGIVPANASAARRAGVSCLLEDVVVGALKDVGMDRHATDGGEREDTIDIARYNRGAHSDSLRAAAGVLNRYPTWLLLSFQERDSTHAG